MERCEKCKVPALQLIDGWCIECRIFNRATDDESITYNAKLESLLSRPGNHTFFSMISKLWSGSIAVQYAHFCKTTSVKYLYFHNGNLITTLMHLDNNQVADSKLNITDLESDTWHLLPADLESEAPIPDRDKRAIAVLNQTMSPARMRFMANCEHADNWMNQ